MKRYINIVLLFFLLLIAGLFMADVPVAEAADGLDNFRRQNTMSSTFSDVSVEDWFYADLKNVYEYGLMVGKSAAVFDPDGNITIAQTITVAARIHSIYHSGTTDFRSGQPWYQTYVDYASANGIPTNWSNYNKEATRAEYAQILTAALPDEALEAINQIDDGVIPDVPLSAPWSREIYKLYRAGVLLGVDDAGTYLPDSSIKRCQVAAIISRMVDRDTRIRKDLASPAAPSRPSESTQPAGKDPNPSLTDGEHPDKSQGEASGSTWQPGGSNAGQQQSPVLPDQGEASGSTWQPKDPNAGNQQSPVVPGQGEVSGNTWQPEDPNAGHQQGTAVPGQQTRPDPSMMGTVGNEQGQPSDTGGGQPQVPETGGGQTAPGVAITDPALILETIEAFPGDRSVPLTISLKNNPGVTAIGLLVSFDERLTLQSAQISQGIGGQSVLSPTMSNPLKLIWIDGLKNMAEDGEFATLTFDVPADVPAGSYQVVIKCLQDDTFNSGNQDVSFLVVNGAIVVK